MRLGGAARDFNGDGWLDAATANPAANSTSVFPNDGIWPSPSAPSITIGDDVAVTEGHAGTVDATFTVRLWPAPAQTVTVRFSTADDGAAAGSDYQAVSRTLIFAPGETTRTVIVRVNGDRLAEPTESFSVHLSDATNASLADATGLATIRDDEPDLSIEGGSVAEGNSGTIGLTFTATLWAPSDAPVTFTYATADLTREEQDYGYGPGATAGVDYIAANETLTFAAGETSKKFTVMVNGDRVSEPSESFLVNLIDSPGAHIQTPQAVGFIVDDEPNVSIEGGSVVEGNSGTRTLTFTVTLSAPSDAPVTVDFATADGEATVAGRDYLAKSGTLKFAPGETSKTFTVTVNGDRLGEYHESFWVHLSGAAGAVISSGASYGTILDDEPLLSVISPAPIREGNSGTKTLTFTVTLSAAYDQAVNVRYATEDGSAVAGSDYHATSGTLTFAAGETTKTVTVRVVGDKKREADESFQLVLDAAGSNAVLYDPYGWGTILDDDSPSKGLRGRK